MKAMKLFVRHLRYPLIGILIGLCLLFYFRKLVGPPFPLAPVQAAEICKSFAGCKSLTFVHRYDSILQRKVVAIYVVVDRKQRKAEIPAQVLAAIEDRQAGLSGFQGWGWTGHRVEAQYE